MLEEGNPERIKMTVEEWSPTTSEADKEFFEKVAPQLLAIKEGILRRPEKSGRPEEEVQHSLKYLQNRLRSLQPGDTVSFARKGDKITGFLILRWEKEEKRIQLEQFFVELADQSSGIGTRLLDSSVQRSRGVHLGESRGIFLTTGAANERAQRLYKKFGFHESMIHAKAEDEIRLDLDF